MKNKANKKFFIKYFGIPFVALLLIFCFIYIQALYAIPNELLIINGEEYTCDFKSPFAVGFLPESQVNLRLNGSVISSNGVNLNLMSPFTLRSDTVDKVKLRLKLFGLIPLKTMVVEAVPNKSVIPCGNTIGVKIYTLGVMVIGTSEIEGIDGKGYEPYKEAGIKLGDYITQINNEKIGNVPDVVKIMDNCKGEQMSIRLIRNNATVDTRIQPAQSYSDNKFRIGLWLRDSTAGIGTLTFYDPDTKAFGALGHGITDADTESVIKISKGQILNSNVISVKKGYKGSPGELRGVFQDSQGSRGYITDNNECGIYGTIPDTKNIVPYNKPMPIALRSQIVEGSAQIISSISGNSTDVYNVEIQKVFRHNMSNSKSMVIKITDNRLINYTGGIVQGMSGSPIIQNGRLVGAVTHVLINDPTRGYGVFIEWMIQKSNAIPPTQVLQNAS